MYFGNHQLRDLFRQLGLPDTVDAIDTFVARHRPLPVGVTLFEAGFWSEAQRAFLHEALTTDGDWSELVDELDNRLR